MMMNKLALAMLLLLYGPASAGAQGINRLTFSQEQTGFVLVPSPAGSSNQLATQPAPNQTSAPLERDFYAILREQSGSNLQRTSKSQVGWRPPHRPDWTLHDKASPRAPSRTPSFSDITRQEPAAWPEIPSKCAHRDYSPKGLRQEVEIRRARYYPLMVAIACLNDVPIELFDALITQESGYNPTALSRKGAIGMAQLMPAAARFAGVSNPWDIAQNLCGGAKILKAHLLDFGRYDLALAAYNSGASRVKSAGRVPQIPETIAYVSSILSDVRRQYAKAIAVGRGKVTLAANSRTANRLSF